MMGAGRSLSRRLILGAMVWIALSLSASGIVLSYTFEQTVRDAFADNLAAQLRGVTAALAIDDAGQISIDDPVEDIRFRQVFSGWYWQISGPEGVLVRSRSLWDETLPPAEGAQPGTVGFAEIKGPRDQHLQTAFTVVNRKGAAGLMLAVAVDTAPLNAQIQRFNRITFAALGTLGLGLALAVVLQVMIGLRPLQRLTSELIAIRNGRQNELPGGHPSEVAPLVDAFNEVLKHDAETLARARREVGNLAHSLKTPLAQMNSNLDALAPSERAALALHINDLRAKIDFYAARAATAAARGATARRVVLSDVAHDIVTALTKIHADANKTARVDLPRTLTVMAEEEDITEVLGNLLDNAFKWAAKTISISATENNAGGIVIVVDDDGPGVAAELREDIVRGRRLDETVPGTGLGLQIVRDIVQAYDGTLMLGESTMGGLRAIVQFPAKSNAASERKP